LGLKAIYSHAADPKRSEEFRIQNLESKAKNLKIPDSRLQTRELNSTQTELQFL